MEAKEGVGVVLTVSKLLWDLHRLYQQYTSRAHVQKDFASCDAIQLVP